MHETSVCACRASSNPAVAVTLPDAGTIAVAAGGPS